MIPSHSKLPTTAAAESATDRAASLSDAELVRAARQGDKRAFVEIVARHQAMVCGIAFGISGDFAASEDAGQEAFLTAWRKIHELREPERLRAWLSQIARNAALGHRRRHRGTDPLENAAELADESPTPDQAAASDEEAALVRDALARLPEIYRLPLILYYREGQSVRAVAQTLDLSEDAVKQRLARGRELLRDRMSGVIESVLTRTGPSPIFTMIIAAAIGALTAPSAIAGSAFATASAAAGATAGSSGTATPLLSLMSTSKTFLVGAAFVAVVCVPVGHHIRTLLPNRTESFRPAPPFRPEAKTPLQAARPSYVSSPLFAQWRALHEQYGTNAAAMPALYKAIAELKDPFRRRAFGLALIAEWVQVDPNGGLQFLLGKGHDSKERRQYLEEWLALDARAAVNALLSAGPGWEETARECLTEIARRVPDRVADVAARLPNAEDYWETNVRDAFALIAEGGLDTARRTAEAMTGPNRGQALSGVARAWAKRDLRGAIEWAKALPAGTDRDEIIRAALVGKATVDPAAALESVDSVPSGRKPGYAASTTGARVLQEAVKTDFDGTMTWIAAHPAKLNREDMDGLTSAVTDRLNTDPVGFLNRRVADGSFAAIVPAIDIALLNRASGERAAVWDWLASQPDTAATRKLKQDVLNSAGYQEPDLALRWAADLPPTSEGDALTESVAKALFNGGYQLHRFDNLYEQAPERLRQPLLEAAFHYLNAETLDDPQRWIARVAQLPEASQPKGLESVARAWAQQAPEEAAAWVNSLSPNSTRDGAAAAIAAAWAAKDARGVSSWVDALPPGAERDRCAQALASAIAERFPNEAWEWALSIGDPAARAAAATQAAKAMAARDPATARQWIESGPLTPEAKAELRSALEQSKR